MRAHDGYRRASPSPRGDSTWIDRRQSIKPHQDATNQHHGKECRHVPHLPTTMNVKLVRHAIRSKPGKREHFAGDMIHHQEGLPNRQNPKADATEQINKAQKVDKVVQDFSEDLHLFDPHMRSRLWQLSLILALY